MSSQGALWDNVYAVNGAAQQGRKDSKCTCDLNSTTEGTPTAQTDSNVHLALLFLIHYQRSDGSSKNQKLSHQISKYHNYSDYSIAHNFEEVLKVVLHFACGHQIKIRETFLP